MAEGQVAALEISQIRYTLRVFSDDEQEQINQLTQSIASEGLLHALTVDALPEGGFQLKAGLKRLIALKQAGKSQVDCLVLPVDMPEEKKQEIHLHENLFRFNLPWWEQVVLKKELFELRQKQKGVGKQGRKVGFSLRDLADELGQGLGTLSEDMRLADAVMLNPNLKKVQDKITAKKLILQEHRRIQQEESAGLPTDIDYNSTFFGNSAEILKHFPDNTFDASITDPPWLDFKIEHLRKDDQTLLVFKELYRVLKQGSFLYAFVSTPDFFIYSQELPKFGFKVAQAPLIWHKKNHISHGTRPWEYGRDFEPILLAVKGNPVLTTSGQLSSVFTYPIVHSSRLVHPNEKPIELIRHIMGHCTFNDALVIEPFGGSGVLAEACILDNRRYVLIEREKEYFDNINKRIDNARAKEKADG